MTRVDLVRGYIEKRRRRFCAVIAALTGMLLAHPARSHAQDYDTSELKDLGLEELLSLSVVSATQTEQTIESAPSAISVITRSDIERWGYRSVQEALENQVGFYIVDDHITPNASLAGVPGGLRNESGLLKVMIDSRPVSFRPMGTNWLGPELIPIDAVERIEIVRGPASAVYGADAFLGVINVISRSGADVAGGQGRLRGGYNVNGSALGGAQEFVVGQRRGDFEVLASGKFEFEDRGGLRIPSSSPAPNVPSFQGDNLTADSLERRSYSGFGKVTYHLGEGRSLTLRGYGSAIDREAQFADWAQLANGVDEEGRTVENRVALANGLADLSLEWAFNQEWNLSASATAFYGRPLPRDRTEVNSSLYYIERRFDSKGVEPSLGLSFQKGGWSVSGATSVVVDHQQLPSTLYVLKQPSPDAEPGDVLSESSTRQGSKTFYNPGVRLQAIWQPVASIPLNLTGGLRYDYHSIYGHQKAGRAGVTYSPESWLNVKVLYGSAFKAPSTLLLYGVPLSPGDVQGNENLRPQFVRTAELQVALLAREWATLTNTFSHLWLNDQAQFLERGGNLVAVNVASSRVFNGDAKLELRYKQLVSGYVDVAYSLAHRDLGVGGYQEYLLGDDNVIYPSWLGHIGVSARPLPGLDISTQGSYVGERRASENNILINGGSYDLGPRFSLRAQVSYGLYGVFADKETRLSLLGTNLLDARGPDPGFGGIDYPLAPRTIMLELSQEL